MRIRHFAGEVERNATPILVSWALRGGGFEVRLRRATWPRVRLKLRQERRLMAL